MNLIEKNLASVHQTIQQSAAEAGRNSADISLLAVSKTRPASDIETAFQAGQNDFGENYLQEALEKIQALQDLPLSWHYIGRIQSNKTRPIAENFSWVHTLDSFKHARRLSEQRPGNLLPINTCIQVNIDEEESKGGVPVDQARQLAMQIRDLPGIKLRGLMTIPQATNDKHKQRQSFHDLAELMNDLNSNGFSLDTLSMGMSGDLDIAIEEGATIVRIGTAIFGQRG